MTFASVPAVDLARQHLEWAQELESVAPCLQQPALLISLLLAATFADVMLVSCRTVGIQRVSLSVHARCKDQKQADLMMTQWSHGCSSGCASQPCAFVPECRKLIRNQTGMLAQQLVEVRKDCTWVGSGMGLPSLRVLVHRH